MTIPDECWFVRGLALTLHSPQIHTTICGGLFTKGNALCSCSEDIALLILRLSPGFWCSAPRYLWLACDKSFYPLAKMSFYFTGGHKTPRGKEEIIVPGNVSGAVIRRLASFPWTTNNFWFKTSISDKPAFTHKVMKRCYLPFRAADESLSKVSCPLWKLGFPEWNSHRGTAWHVSPALWPTHYSR